VSRLVEVPLSSGGSITVEVEEARGGRTMRGGDRGMEVLERSQQTLEEGLGVIAPALRELLGELRAVSRDLSEIEVELGLKLTGEAGMVVARAGAEANFRVLVRWRRPDESEVHTTNSEGQPANSEAQ
jgi:hypothetical protein